MGSGFSMPSRVSGSRAANRVAPGVGVLLVLLGLTGSAAGQPLAWSVQYQPLSQLGPYVGRLLVLDLGTGVVDASFTIPDGITAGHGVLTADGRYYLVPTNLGVARFRTAPPALDRMIGVGVAVSQIVVEPGSSRLHAIGDFGHAVLDWETGQVLSVECCTQPRILFTPDGRSSVYLEARGTMPISETRVAVFAEPGHIEQWSVTVPGQVTSQAVSGANLAIVSLSLGQTVIWNLGTGTAQGRLPPATALAWRADTLLMSQPVRLLAYDLPDLTGRVLLERGSGPSATGGLGVFVSSDGVHAYWLRHWSLLGVSVSGTVYHVIDIDTGTMVAEGSFGPRFQGDLTLEAASQCLRSVQAMATVAPEGGNAEILVSPGAACRPWREPAALNPGPHTGPATLLIPVAPNPTAALRTLTVRVTGRDVRIEQPTALAGAPTLTAAADGNRFRLAWSPTRGGGVLSWMIRGALAGGVMSDVARVDADTRTWLSPPLPPGAYDMEVVAENTAGRSAASNRVRLSVGLTDVPEAPESLAATVVEDFVVLSWAPPSHGPVPAAYVVEATVSPRNGPVPVLTTSMTSVSVPSVAFSWSAVRVRARTDGGLSQPSGFVTVTTSPCTAPPSAPGDAWSVTTGATSTLRWSAPAAGAARDYVIQVGTVLGTADLGAFTVPGSTLELTAPTPGWPTRAVVQIRARNGCGVSPPSAPVAVPGY